MILMGNGSVQEEFLFVSVAQKELEERLKVSRSYKEAIKKVAEFEDKLQKMGDDASPLERDYIKNRIACEKQFLPGLLNAMKRLGIDESFDADALEKDLAEKAEKEMADKAEIQRIYNEVINPFQSRLKRLTDTAKRLADRKVKPLVKGCSYSRAQKREHGAKWAIEYNRYCKRIYSNLNFIERHYCTTFNVTGFNNEVWNEFNG